MSSSADGRRPRKTRKDLRREATRAALLDAARLQFAEYGYDAVSVTDIARAAGVSHSMINVYFNGKAGLLYEIVKDLNGPQRDRTHEIAQRDAAPRTRLSTILRDWLDHDLKEPRLLAVLQSYSWVWPPETEAENRHARAEFQAELSHVIRAGQTDGCFAASPDPDLAAEAIWALYTWNSRSVIFEEHTAEACHARLMDQVDALLGVRA